MENPGNEFEHLKAVILVGPLDFGRCKLASSIPPALWPMIDKPALTNVVEQLVEQGVKNITICSKVNSSHIEKAVEGIGQADIKVIIDEMPSGTAGALRDAADEQNDQTLILIPAGMAVVPDIKRLVASHLNSNSELSVAFHKPLSPEIQPSRSADIFIAKKEILNYIPSAGYCDIKENLIPKLVKDNKTIRPIVLDIEPGNFRNVPQYLSAMSIYLASGLAEKQYPDLNNREKFGKGVYTAANCQIDETVKIYGPAVIFNDVEIHENVCLNGPVVVGSCSFIAKNCTVSDSFLWYGSGVFKDSVIQNAVIGYDTQVRNNCRHSDTCITAKKVKTEPVFLSDKNINSCLKDNYVKILATGSIVFVVVLLALIASYWSTLSNLANIWQISDEYSAGMLVPFLAGYVLWTRRKDLSEYVPKPAFSGLILLFGAVLMRFAGLYLDLSSLQRLSFILSIGAVVLLILGWRLFFKLIPVILFLVLMIPLPNQINAAFSLKLQQWSTTSAVWVLEMMGYLVKRDGNIITIDDTSVAVAEACNGLRMIMAFFVIAGWFSLLVQRKWWEKLLIFVSALPISILCNTIRLAITSIAFTMIDAREWSEIFHDYGGYAMMPLAIAIILGELWILKNIFIIDEFKPAVQKQQVIERKK